MNSYNNYNYVFIKIPRTATNSMNQILQQYRGHASAQHWIDKIGQDDWDKAFTFTVVRHPFTRFVSAYYLRKKSQNGEIEPLNEYISNGIPDEVVFRPQYTFVYDWKDELLVDKVYKYEELDEVWPSICERCQVEYQPLPHNHKTLEEKEKLSPESEDYLYGYYKNDFKYFNYSGRDNSTT